MTSFQYHSESSDGVTQTQASGSWPCLGRNNPRRRGKRQIYFSVAELLQNGFTLFRLTEGRGGVGLVVRREAGKMVLPSVGGCFGESRMRRDKHVYRLKEGPIRPTHRPS